MKVEESGLVVIPQIKHRQVKYHHQSTQEQTKQLQIDDFLNKKKKRLSENSQLINPCPKKPKMMLHQLNSKNNTNIHNFCLMNSNDKLNCYNSVSKIANHLETNNSQTSLLFNRKTGLPLSSSPIPQQKSSFRFERSIKSSNAIKRAILNKEPETDENFNLVVKKSVNKSPASKALLGSFEESILNGRLDPVNTIINGFRAEIGTSGSIFGNFFCPDHLKMPVTVNFYNISEIGNIFASPYLAKVNLGKKGYLVPRKGNVQVTLFNPEDNVIKMFVVQYDLSEMPPNSQSFVRQKTYYMPKCLDNNSKNINNSKIPNNITNCDTNNSKTNKTNSNEAETSISIDNLNSLKPNHSHSSVITNSYSNLIFSKNNIKDSEGKNKNSLCNIKYKSCWLHYLIHLRFLSSKSGKIYLHRDIRMLVFRKNEFDPGNLKGQTPTFHWKTITEQPNNPKFSSR